MTLTSTPTVEDALGSLRELLFGQRPCLRLDGRRVRVVRLSPVDQAKMGRTMSRKGWISVFDENGLTLSPRVGPLRSEEAHAALGDWFIGA